MRKRQPGSTVALLKLRLARRDVNLVAQSSRARGNFCNTFPPTALG